MTALDRQILTLAAKPDLVPECRALLHAAGALQAGKITLNDAISMLGNARDNSLTATDLRRARDAVANSLLHPPCPHDTNGDGDCGRPLCPICHPSTSTGP